MALGGGRRWESVQGAYVKALDPAGPGLQGPRSVCCESAVPLGPLLPLCGSDGCLSVTEREVRISEGPFHS